MNHDVCMSSESAGTYDVVCKNAEQNTLRARVHAARGEQVQTEDRDTETRGTRHASGGRRGSRDDRVDDSDGDFLLDEPAAQIAQAYEVRR